MRCQRVYIIYIQPSWYASGTRMKGQYAYIYTVLKHIYACQPTRPEVFKKLSFSPNIWLLPQACMYTVALNPCRLSPARAYNI